MIKFNNIPITLCIFYTPLPPSYYFTNYLSTIKNNFITVGDFNAKYISFGCRSNNLRDTVLYNFINPNNFNKLSQSGPAYWPSSPRKYSDILKIFLPKLAT